MNANVIIKKASDGTTRLNAQIGVGSKRNYMLMEHDYLTLKFSTDTPTLLHLGDYVEIENVGRYELTSPTRGELNKSTGGYDYEIRLDAQYWKFKNKLCKFLPQIGGNETNWTYTDTITNHAQQIIANMRAQAYGRDQQFVEHFIPGREGYLYMGFKDGSGDWYCEIDDSVDKIKAITLQYDSTNIIDAIAQIAEAFECEWWFEQNCLHFGKCEYGSTPVKLEMGQELVAISRTDSKETYATRIYAYGSDRNIASNYRKALVFDASLKDSKLLDTERPLELGWFYKPMLGQMTADPREANFVADINWGIKESNVSTYGVVHHDGNPTRYTTHGDCWVDTGHFGTGFISGREISPGSTIDIGLSTIKVKFKLTDITNTGRNNTTINAPLKVSAYTYIDLGHARTSDGSAYETIPILKELEYKKLNDTLEFSFDDQHIKRNYAVTSVNVSMRIFIEFTRENEPEYGSRDTWEYCGKFGYESSAKGTFTTSAYVEHKAEGITIEVLDKKTGDVSEIIEGAIFNEAYESENRKLTLPAGKTIAPGAKYRLPQINTAVVPARYFTSIYTVFEKYSDVTSNGIVNSRLLLPEYDEDGNPLKGYIDVLDFESEEEAVEDVVIFEDIYPSRISTITSLQRSDEYTIDQNEQDGSTTRKTYREYIYTDDLFTEAAPFNRDYEIDGVGLQVTFQSGLLNGMTFDVELLEDNRHFQIKRDDATDLPNEIIKPKEGDEFILAGFNIAMLSDANTDYNSNAEKELLTKAREYAAKINTDTSTYQCTVACDVAYEVEEDSPDGLYLGIGRSVNLIHPGYFANGRISRVLGYEIPLDFAYDNPVYYIGEKASYSRIGAIEDQLDDMGNRSGNFGSFLGGSGTGSTGGGGSSTYVIQQIDTTPPTDKNVYSALRARLEFALKTAAQKIKYIWEFIAGIRIGSFIAGQSGAQIDAGGNAEVESIKVRSFMKVHELIYNRLNAQEGDTSFSDVGTIEQIITNADGTQTALMRLRWDGDITTFQQGDIVYGYVNNLNNNEDAESYKVWAWVKEVNRVANQLTLVKYPDTEVPAGINYPMTQGMVITRWGNIIEPSLSTYLNASYRNAGIIVKRGEGDFINTRQNSFFISCEGGHICELMGVNKPILEPGNYGTILGKIPEGLLDEKTEELINKDQPYLFARGIIVQDLIRIGYEGVTTRTANYRGMWSAQTAASTTDYYRSTPGMYDTVTCNGALWQCVASKTLDEPKDSSAAWVKMTASLDDGKEVRIWLVNPSANIVSVRKNEVRPERLSATVTLNSSDNTTQIFTNNYDLLLAGAKIYYSADGLAWHEFIIGQEEPLDLEDETGVIELENSSGNDNILTVGGNDISTSDIGDRIYFELRDADTGDVLHSTQVPVVKDGIDGITGDWTSYAFKQSLAKPDTPVDDQHTIPTGWQDAPTGNGRWWMSKAVIDGTTQKPKSSWSDPVQCTAEDGVAGQYTDFKYKVQIKGQSPTVTNRATRNPDGWSDTPPTLFVGYDLWMIQADIDHDNKVIDQWSLPVRISGEKGDKGDPGKDGQDGLMVYPAGYYDPNTTYTAISETTPVVMYGDNFYVLRRGCTYKGSEQANNRNTPALEVANAPANASRWIIFDKFNAIFADILMADFAKLSSAVFCGDWMISQQGTRNGEPSNEYQYFKDGSFIPNYSVNFKTGQINAGSGIFSGYLKTKFVPLSKSDAIETIDTRDNTKALLIQNDVNILSIGKETDEYRCLILLPSDIEYAGTRVTICDFSGYSRSSGLTHIRIKKDNTSWDPTIGGVAISYTDSSGNTRYSDRAEEITIRNGVVELLGVSSDFYGDYDPNNPYYATPRCIWFVLNNPAGMTASTETSPY